MLFEKVSCVLLIKMSSRLLLIINGLVLVFLLGGCGMIPWYTSRNEEYASSAERVLRASFTDWSAAYKTSNVFVGVSLSGGGSRAANLSAATLQELEDIGFLDHLTAISSVSGGSLTAAYYGLFRQTPSWDWKTFRERLREDFFGRFSFCDFFGSFLAKTLNPLNSFLRYFTHYDRSDMMAEVFDEKLFGNKKFQDLGKTGPKIFINATDLLGDDDRHAYHIGWYGIDRLIDTPKQPFVFVEEEFNHVLRSRLDTYPMSHAVIASGAFPLVFNNVTLRNYTPQIRLEPDDIVSPKGLAMKWRFSEDPISRFLREKSSPRLRELLNNYDGDKEPSPELLNSMWDALNYVIHFNSAHPRFYSGEQESFPKRDLGIELGEETKRLLARDEAIRLHHRELQDYEKYERARLHRLLLEDAYPSEIGKSHPTYIHLFDGGPSDNLGLETLLETAQSFYDNVPQGHKPGGCFIFSVDAHVTGSNRHFEYEPDTRVFLDYLFDRNAIAASDAMLGKQRMTTLRKGTIPDPRNILRRYKLHSQHIEMHEDPHCVVWHINFNTLLGSWLWTKGSELTEQTKIFESKKRYFHRQLHSAVSAIETHYKLTGPKDCSAKFIQEMLYKAAHLLVRADSASLGEAQKWFKEHLLHLKLPAIPISESLIEDSFYKDTFPVVVGEQEVVCVPE